MIKTKEFGKLSSGEVVDEIILENENGIKLSVLTYGATIKNFWVPGRQGEIDIVLGFNTLQEYEMNVAYFGVVVGRVAGRIGGGVFELDGKHVNLVKNDRFQNHLHGGVKGLSKTNFQYQVSESETGSKITFIYDSIDGEDHYPGAVEYQISYTLTKHNRVLLEYFAKPSCPTPISLTQHSYFNLNGEASKETIDNHELYIDSKCVLELDAFSIPTGKYFEESRGFFDLSEGIFIGDHFEKFKNNMLSTQGFDHPFVLGASKSAKLSCSNTGISFEVKTSEPIIVCYSGNMLGWQIGKSGYEYKRHMGICLETQQYPNAVNIFHFPSTIYTSENPYHQQTEWVVGCHK